MLTPDDLAARLQVSAATIYRMQADGQIPGRLVRGKLRFVWSEVVKALPRAPATRQESARMQEFGVREVRMLKQLVRLDLRR